MALALAVAFLVRGADALAEPERLLTIPSRLTPARLRVDPA